MTVHAQGLDDRLRARVLEVLHSGQARRIRFRYQGLAGPVAVDASSFSRVASAIESRPPRIRVVNGSRARVFEDRSTTGAYDVDSNRFYVRPAGRNSRIWESTIVHEAVHASIDLTRSHIAIADNEAAAFLAGAMYLVMTGFPLPRWGRQASWENLVRDTARQALTTGRVNTDDMSSLREQLLMSGYNRGRCGSMENPLFERGSG